MTARTDGGPAFPTHPALYSSADAGLAQGMSLRDWFAGQALLDVSGTNPNLPGDPADTTEWPKPMQLARRRARWAYIQADAMLEKRATK